MVGARAFSIRPRRGEYVLLDTNVKGLANSILFQPPTSAGKGVLVTPTVDGNILIGPTAEPVQEKTATETTEKGQRNILEVAKRTIPELTKRFAINSFQVCAQLLYR